MAESLHSQVDSRILIFSSLEPEHKIFLIWSRVIILTLNGYLVNKKFCHIGFFISSFKLSIYGYQYMSTENRDVIFIGKKPLMAYVTSTLIQLANLPAVRIKARGLSIGRAVDVSQIISRKTEHAGYSIGEIKIGSEQLESQDGKTRNVSTIEIEVKRNAS
jgi:DNA-binding protein